MSAATCIGVWLTLASAGAELPKEKDVPPRHWSMSLEAGGSLIEPSLSTGLELAVQVGGPWLLLRAEWNPWITLQQAGANTNRGVANVGLGGELRYFNGRMRSVAYLGASVLLFQSAFDSPGTFGPFVGVLPASFRFPLSRTLTARVDPLSFHLFMPSLGSIPLVVFQYRHSASIEYAF